jgi:hypothetical protein
MPPRRRAAALPLVGAARAPPPHDILLLLFAQLPADVRARCACVCRAWRAAAAERSLWTRRLDVSFSSGVTAPMTDALLHGAAARAGGGLQALDVSGSRRITPAALRAVATANAGALTALRVCHGACDGNSRPLQLAEAEALLRAAPQLQELDADVLCNSVDDARRMLAAQGFLAPLRARGLRLAHADVRELGPDLAAHAWLRQLCLIRAVPSPWALDAVVDAALASRRLTSLHFENCYLPPAGAPALARLLYGNAALPELSVRQFDDRRAGPLLDADAAEVLAGALRANATLTELTLEGWRVFDSAAAAVTLLGALAAHASLRTLRLRDDGVREWDAAARAAVGAALGALVAADAPALTALSVSDCHLGDAGMAPLFAALPQNTHLRSLACAENDVTEACARDALLPAVRANAGLRALDVGRRAGSARTARGVVNGRAAAAP